jgi:3-oxoacyl-[acyl-carrier-protein] synthase II
MTASSRRVVITGMGVVTPLGLDARSFWISLCTGRSGVDSLSQYENVPGAAVRDFDPRAYLDKKERKRLPVMERQFQFAVACAKMAVEDAQLKPEAVDPTRFGTVFGAAVNPGELSDLGQASRATRGAPHDEAERLWGAGLANIPPMWLLARIPNMMSCHVSIIHNAQGPSNTITQSDLAGLLALGEAWRLIRSGRADVVLAGGADTKLTAGNWVKQNVSVPLARRREAPSEASRPFDRDRDGLVLGEGGGVFIVEELAHARRRKAPIYAELTGFSSAFDRSADRGIGRWPERAPRGRQRPYATRPRANGLLRAVGIAMLQAGITAADLDHINVQGYSTVADDAWEARSLSEFASDTPVFAAKSYFGNLGAASGPVELAASLLALRHGAVPATLNYETPDPECPLRVAATLQPMQRSNVLKVGFTELGQCAALVCRAMEER